VPLNKILVGKPILTTDASNTGWVNQTDLGEWAAEAFSQYGWFAGIGHWEYPSDTTGASIADAAGPLMALCAEYNNCTESY